MAAEFFSSGYTEIAPILQWRAWWGGLGVVGTMLLGGWALAPRVRRDGWSWASAWLLRAALGFVPAALAMLLAGQFPGLALRFPWSLTGLAGWAALAGSGAGAWRARRRHGPTRTNTDRTPTNPDARAWRIAGWGGWAAVALWLATMLNPAFCPSTNYDVLEYHLGIVSHVFATGRVRPIPHVFYTAQPIATEMFHLMGAAIEGTPWGYAPGVVQWLMLVLGTLLFVRLARALRIPAAFSPWLWLILLAHPTIFRLEVDRMTDWPGVMLLAAGAWLWAEGRTMPRTRGPHSGERLIWMGLLAGGAVGAKWTHAGTVALPLALMALELGSRKVRPGGVGADAERAGGPALRGAIGGAGWFALGGAGAFGAWPCWLALVAGNPIAPFGAHWFPTAAWPPQRLDFLLATHGKVSPLSGAYWVNLLDRLLLTPPSFPLAWIGLCACLGAAAVARARGRRGARAMRAAWTLGLGLAGSILLWGQLLHAAERFLAPALLLSAASMGLALGEARRWARRGWPRRVVDWSALGALALGAVCLMRSPLLVLEAIRCGSHARGETSRIQYVYDLLGLTAQLFQAANALPPGSRLLAINEARRYPFRYPIQLATVFDRQPIRPYLSEASDAADLERRLSAAGYTHLLFNEFEQARLLAMHTPPGLLHDTRLLKAIGLNSERARGRDEWLVRNYRGWAEFAADPPGGREKAVYLEFLDRMRARAIWMEGHGPDKSPAMWIAPLESKP